MMMDGWMAGWQGPHAVAGAVAVGSDSGRKLLGEEEKGKKK